MTILQGHNAILDILATKYSSDLQFPPECMLHMDTEFMTWDSQQKTLCAHFPLKTPFQNPRQFMQGGFVVAALDNVLGPLSYLSDAPSVTTQLNTSFIRPVAPQFDFIEVVARIDEQTSTKVYSSAEARSPAGKLLSTVQATSQIVKPKAANN